MEFEPIETAGSVHINYEGPSVDVATLAIVQLNLQIIIDAVSDGMMYEQRPFSSSWYNYYRGTFGQPVRIAGRVPRALRSEVRSISSGSLTQEIVFSLATVLSSQTFSGIFQGLAANIVYGIGRSGVARFSGTEKLADEDAPTTIDLNGRDLFDVGPNVKDIITALAENTGSKPSKLKIKATEPDGKVIEIVLEINPKRR